MNTFEFNDIVAPTVPSTSWKNGWLLALCLLWNSTNLADLTRCLHARQANVAIAQANALRSNVERIDAIPVNTKQVMMDLEFISKWMGNGDTFGVDLR